MITTSGRSLSKAIALGILICGTLDIADALIFYGVRSHVSPILLLQGIARSILGKPAYAGGIPTALLGLLIHYAIATTWVILFILIAQHVTWMFRNAVLAGVLYGLAVYAIMNFVAVPLTRIGHRPQPTGIALVNAILAIVLFIGVAVALINKRYAPLP
jgi:hypothetical protein